MPAGAARRPGRRPCAGSSGTPSSCRGWPSCAAGTSRGGGWTPPPRHEGRSVKCLVFHGTGGREVMAVEERPDPAPGRFDVLVAPAFAGVNPADVLQREGRHPVPPGYPPDIPGLEVAGSVVAVGDGVASFAPGDRVFGLVGGGGQAQLVLAEERHLLRVPETLSERAAAAAPQSFLTAFDAVVNQGRTGAGDVVLVNGASGGVGSAAVQIAA